MCVFQSGKISYQYLYTCIKYFSTSISVVSVNIYDLEYQDFSLRVCTKKAFFLVSQPKHMLWVLKRTVLLSTQNICYNSQCTSDIDNSVAKRSDTGKTVVYCRTRHLVGKLFLYFIH